MDKAFVSLLLVATLLDSFFQPTHQSPLPNGGFSGYNETSQMNNRTIAELVQRQTDTIKKIVSNHRPLEYPLLTKYQSDEPKTQDTETLSLEDLKIRCQHLAKLINATSPPPPPSTSPRPETARPAAGFYITTETPPPTKPPPVKYIKLEPVILQKTILGDGRTIYYWHKSLPSAVQVAPAPSTPPPTTTTQGYNFRNFFPSFYSAGGAEPAGEATTEKTPAALDRPEEVLYQQQLRFVVPVYVPPEESDPKKSWQHEQFAYYAKPPQPEITLQVPYVPTLHVIKTLTVANQNEASE